MKEFTFSDGSEVYKGRHHRLPLRITEVGSDQGMSTSPQYLQVSDLLHGIFNAIPYELFISNAD